MQTEHHLFPSVNHCHLYKLAPHVKALCKKHGVQYNECESLFEALSLHVAHLRKYAFE
jgi:delta11-fatty-acid desaturase